MTGESKPESRAIYRMLPVNPCVLRVISGHEAIAREILAHLGGRGKAVVVCDGFSGVRWDLWKDGLDSAFRACGVEPAWIDSREAQIGSRNAALSAVLAFHLTDEPVFGRIYRGKITDFFDPGKLQAAVVRIQRNPGITIVYGAGASLIAGRSDCVVYVDVSKQEFQQRCVQKSVTNFSCADPGAFEEMYKRAYYIDWPVLNLEKRRLMPLLDILVDETYPLSPKAVRGGEFRSGLADVARSPVRVKPFFQAGPWGGQWMKQNFDLPPGPPNYAWSFELYAPENGILIGNEREWLEVSFDYLLWQEADAVMGPAVTSIFGSDFPIRFDYLDTIRGGNLSCQVHPRPDYIREEFGEPFTQHETYYVMQSEPGARVYLGVREDTEAAEFRKAATRADHEGIPFEIDRFVNSLPSAPHDLFLIPAGTVHCSGAGNLVLEISATPCTYTFKIYDYLRKDLSGHLRHVFVDRAFANIDFARRSEWVSRHLKQAPRRLRGDGDAAEYVIGDLDLLFFKIHRLEFNRQIADSVNGRFLVLNLVEGDRIDIRHGAGSTELRYGETLIVPASVGDFQLSNSGTRPCKVVKAFIR